MLKRLKLACQRVEGKRERPSLRKLTRESSYVLAPLTKRIRPAPQVTDAEVKQVVMLLPGFLAPPSSMRYLGQQCERAGHVAAPWGAGANLGPTAERLALAEKQLATVHARYGQKVVLLGWSLGGLFARELARRHPTMVAKVITMGSPFSGDPRANNAWRLYQLVTGHAVDAVPLDFDTKVKPAAQTVALWSPRDGVISPRSACGLPNERDRAEALRCTHMGFVYSSECVEAVLAELARE